ncbi:MAG: ATP-dependent RNA helicase DbpA [Campylobacteraceae bacterium]|jgi:ATP-independent RNA helicase DbpA|nr:ATP-dependent RNA helicase DbpA [Campylobacteraceae bacterium]MBT3882452.1 ATP-dependent RNA helicase DbpA [Campylobacteraceae bacterium]MBT4030256.1 ATP-dependent RNA helicase DbpA [Campylobacteraceae bacterium]MBT4178918.1 ATP-dependent RNA helicase DbpA [Campylobacteraceae bacterium]MBT4572874.1 ATP-dependent RNA helicase DbpA [Campylobacteraceae bacterium]
MTFTQLNLPQSMTDTLNSMQYKEMTPIQEKSLPLILEGEDIIAKAKTGSGKTAAFGIGVLNKLNVKKFRIQSMVMCPTRELADQVATELRKIARFKHNIKIITLCGGVPFMPQKHSLSHQAHIIVGTPGRILKHLKEGSFEPNSIETLVLDEADRMLDMGFSEDIHEIISYIPTMRQTLLFSATYPENIEELGHKILMDPITVEVESTHAKSTIVQEFYEVDEDIKAKAVEYALAKYGSESSIIFCNTKIGCDELADNLEDAGLDVLVLHSDLDQRDRDETLILFSNKSYPILIATDVAARGIDVKDIDLVINYDLPHDNEVYVHRIGRTARAGASGRSISFVEDKYRLDDLEDALDTRIDLENVSQLETNEKFDLKSKFSTIFINGGKKSKVRAGDILGALTAGVGLSKDDIGKIDILQFCSYVAVKKEFEQKAFDGLSNGKIKGKYFRVFLK